MHPQTAAALELEREKDKVKNLISACAQAKKVLEIYTLTPHLIFQANQLEKAINAAST